MKRKGLNIQNSLKIRLIFSFFILVTIPSTIIGVFSYLVSYAAIEDKINRYSSQVVMQTANNLEGLLRNVEDISLQIVSLKIIGEHHKLDEKDTSASLALENQIRGLLGNVISSRNEIVGVNILYEESNKVLVYGEPLVDLETYKTSSIYHSTIQAPSDPFWMRTYKNPNNGVTYTHIATCSRKIIDKDSGDLIGVLVIGVKEFSIADTYSYLDLGPNGYSFIIDKEGYVVSELNKRLLSQHSKDDYIKDIVGNRHKTPVFKTDIKGEEFLVAYSEVSYADWIMISVVPYRYLMQEIRQYGFLTFEISILFVVLATVISLLISYSIFNPVEKLNQNMKEIEKGNLSIRTPIKGQHEIAQLSSRFNKMAEQIDYLINQVYVFKLMKNEAEIHALQAQINPHFLYNTLTVIDGMAMKSGNKDISEVSQLLASIFRYSTSGGDYATLQAEMEQIESYMKLQAIRRDSKFSYLVEIEETVRQYLMPKLLLQPIIENAFVHGIDDQRNNSFIHVKAGLKDACIEIVVRDNGCGIDEVELEALNIKLHEVEDQGYWQNNADGHIGIVNVHQRIKNFSGDAYGIRLKSIAGVGTEVVLAMKMKVLQ